MTHNGPSNGARINSRRKGANAERAVVRWLRGLGWDARRYLSGDGLQPGDVDCWPAVCVEVKDCVGVDILGWLRQAEAEAGPDQLPVVFAKRRLLTDPGDWPAILRTRDLVHLLQAAKVIPAPGPALTGEGEVA